jgi:hypothetical protein
MIFLPSIILAHNYFRSAWEPGHFWAEHVSYAYTSNAGMEKKKKLAENFLFLLSLLCSRSKLIRAKRGSKKKTSPTCCLWFGTEQIYLCGFCET